MMRGILVLFLLALAAVSTDLATVNEEAVDGTATGAQDDKPTVGTGKTFQTATSSCVDDELTCALLRATKWLLAEQEDDWGWNGGTSTSSVVLAMQLANESWYHERSLKTQLAIKQLELELLVELARSNRLMGCSNTSQRHTRLAKISPGRLALYVLALESTCHDTRDFFSNDLVELLEHNMKHFPREGFNNHFQYALGVLALCQSGDGAVKVKHIRELLQGQNEGGCYRFDGEGPDVASMALMALSCARDSVPPSFKSRYQHKVNKTISCIMSKQREDGSISNAVSTALASQALTAAGVSSSLYQDTLQHVLNSQHEDGHFGNLGATTQILPLLAHRHYGSVKDIKAACIRNAAPVSTPGSDAPSAPTKQLGPPITIQIVLENSIDEDQEPFTVSATAPAGSTLFEFLQVARDNSAGAFRFESKKTDFGNSMTSFNGVANDGANHWYWIILIGPDRESAKTGVDGIIPEDGVDYIFYYKAF